MGSGKHDPAQVRFDRSAHRRSLAADRTVASGIAASARWAARLLLIAAALWVLWIVLGWTWPMLLPVVLGLFVSTLLWPPVRFLRRLLPQTLAVLVVMLGAVAVVAGVVALLVPQVRAEVPGLVERGQQGFDSLREWAAGPPLNLGDSEVQQIIDDTTERLQGSVGTIADWVLTGLSAVGSVLATLVLTAVLAFFMLRDGHRFLPWLRGWAGVRAGGHLVELGGRLWSGLGSYLWAQTVVALVDAVFIGVGLVIIGVPFALVLAVIVFVTGYLPIVGAFVSGALAVLVALASDGIGAAIAVLAVVVVVQQLEGNLLAPLLVGHSLRLHPVLVLGALAIGGAVGGIIGAFLAVPIASAVVTSLRYAREQVAHRGEQDTAARAGPDGEPAGG